MSLKQGKTGKIKASVKVKKKVNYHTAKFRYESSDETVATVTKKGKVKAIGAGSCNIYVYAQNGLNKKIKVTVK
ncbi:MAG: Ig-like domain-containing protein [Lachnospiraceae bacterium]|nr:Ig-like domain-containing protein [Lachnospiraceae bacterium]